MNARPSTPGERAAWWEILAPIASYVTRERRVLIVKMLAEQVSSCRVCETPVRRCDPRRLDEDDLLHAACVSDAGSVRGRDGGQGVTSG